MAVGQLEAFLDQEHIKYVTIRHSRAFTAPEIAESAHVRGKELAKTVIVALDGRDAMVVIPAHYSVDLELLKKVSGSKDVALATEEEFKDRFPDCEIGAMPPFGNLYDMEVFVEKELSSSGDVVFNAGSHTELIRMAYADYERLVAPKVVQVSRPG